MQNIMPEQFGRDRAARDFEHLDGAPGQVQEDLEVARVDLRHLGGGGLEDDRGPGDVENRDQERLAMLAAPDLQIPSAPNDNMTKESICKNVMQPILSLRII